ncbi:EAL domain-containing protein [Bacillaceae bacterium SIJ1]|uniref:EAL domain-containing protein n=1 Tax=Litoribacterium kuwaitense TaxID=1398745 RepID=UPI0013EC065E|nr:EAL-associated domain-containing protein [Litoribacterium kuwaitense]NGP44418.1 EAL domain-containing protein [Litoribacterium kuwaitense]
MMDPLDILTQKANVRPYFQGVFSADDWQMNACEVYGRFVVDEKAIGLGAFFHDANVPEEYRFELDAHIYKQAIELFMNSAGIEKLFLNAHPDVLLAHGEEFIDLFLTFEREFSLPLESVVIEICVHTFQGDLEHLHHFITYLKTYGMKISLDRIGVKETNLDVIGLLSPHYVKVNLRPMLDQTKPQSYDDVLQSLTHLARKIGAVMIYQEIETEFQLQYAWRNGGQYYQGNFLDRPSSFITPATSQDEALKQTFSRFINHEKKKIMKRMDIEKQLQRKMAETLERQKAHQCYDEWLTHVAADFQNESFRLYVCDRDGFQRSANLVKKEAVWELQKEYNGKNWGWRPYFLENIVRMDMGAKGILSDLYSDIETKQHIRTFSYPISQQLYLFMDLSYEYLFDQNDHV